MVSPSFLVPDRLPATLATLAPFVLVGFASTPSILSGGIDISVGPLATFINCLFIAVLLPSGLGDWYAAIPILLIAAGAIGAVTGLLVAVVRLHPVVASTGVLFVLIGLSITISRAPVSAPPNWSDGLAQSSAGSPVRPSRWASSRSRGSCCAARPIVRNLLATGESDVSAFGSGVNVTAVRVLAYTLGGLFAGVAGIALSALLQSSQSSLATTYALLGLAAAVLGGTALGGGKGGPARHLLRSRRHLPPAAVADRRRRPAEPRAVRLRARARGRRGPRSDAAEPTPHKEPRMTESTIATVTQSLSTPLPPPSGWLRFRTWALRTPFIQFIVLIALSAVLVALVPAFIARPQAAIAVLVLASLLALAAMGQTLVVILGGLDLAIIGYVTFGAMIASNATSRLGWPVPIALLVVLLVCGGVGAGVGWLCHRFRVQPLVMTLGVGVMLAGGSMFLANGDYNGQPPQELKSLAQLSARPSACRFRPSSRSSSCSAC